MKKTKLWTKVKQTIRGKPAIKVTKIGRKKHSLSRKQISNNALKVLYRLHESGYLAYLVGGSVRDLLLGRQPKDFDVATNATPEQVREIFRNSRIIGRRFRLVHVYFSGETIEVSTFRANIGEFKQEQPKESMLQNDNVFGTIEEDAWRRDFTVNALYYNIADYAISDFTQGMKDLRKKRIRMIGDPNQRYHEDPVRMLRAIRLAAKCNFSIEPETAKPISKLLHLLSHVPPARIFDEILKLFFEGNAEVTFRRLQEYGLITSLFPESAKTFSKKDSRDSKLILLALKATDHRFANGLSLNPGFLLSVFLWPAFQKRMKYYLKKNKRLFHAIDLAMEDTISKQLETVKIPKRLIAMIRTIWILQFYLQRRRARRVYRVYEDRYFRAAFDFLELRVKNGERLKEILAWWSKFRNVDKDTQRSMIEKRRGKK